MKFVPTDPDPLLSPFTGMVRRHWVESGRMLLDGVLAHVPAMEAPIVFPRRSVVSYPGPDAAWYSLRAEEMEGLARTFLVAAPLVEEDPGLKIRGIDVREYYARAILRACDPASPSFMGRPEEIAAANGGRAAQQLVEVAGLCVGLMSARRSIWERYAPAERRTVIACLQDYAAARTNPHNWRFFNVLVGAFLQAQNIPVDETAMDAHLQGLLSWYGGDGWYRDGIEFDYYSAWAFQFYGPLWCDWIGYRTRPEIAELIERRHGELMENYPCFFGRQGESLLWGRSAIYRCAASAPLTVAFKLRTTPLDPGWARRIASGNLRQFLGREDLWTDGIPSLGFHGPCDAVLQGYSCAASPFWLAKIYQALALPADSPFWTSVENEGAWSGLDGSSRTLSLPGPGLTVTLHGSTGAAECRPAKVGLAQAWYQRLVFNTAFPWEADDGQEGTAMSYALRRLERSSEFIVPSSVRYAGMRGDVLYRQISFKEQSFLPAAVIDLAEIILPGGMLRVDRARIFGGYELALGSFGLPHLGSGKPLAKARPGSMGKTMSLHAKGRAVLVTTYLGWDAVVCHEHAGCNVEASGSSVLHAVRRCDAPEGEVMWLVSLLKHRTDDEDWTADEADPVKTLTTQAGAGLIVRFKNGDVKTVDFTDIEGRPGG